MPAQPSSGRFSMDDYIDVAERIAEFTKKYPEGTLQTISWNVRTIDEQTFIVYRAAAYRTPDDPRPGMGIAWEPFPGKTPYTHDSELMNAETAAWGRAIVACGLPSKKIASRQEVQARQNGGEKAKAPALAAVSAQPAAAPEVSNRPMGADQRKDLKHAAERVGLSPSEFANIVLVATGNEERAFADEQAAARWLARQLDRLPARYADVVLDGIGRL